MEEWKNASVSESGAGQEVHCHEWKIRNFDTILQAWVNKAERSYFNQQTILMRAGATIGYSSTWKLILDTYKIHGSDHCTECLIVKAEPYYKIPGADKLFVQLLIYGLSPGPGRQAPLRCDKINLNNQTISGTLIHPGDGSNHAAQQYRKMLLDNMKNEDGTWSLKLKLILTTSLTESSRQMVEYNQMEKLASDIGKLVRYTESPNSDTDIEFQIMSGGKLYAHRAILKARSQVFERMFAADMQESKTGIVEIKDVSMETMKLVLQYIYTGRYDYDQEFLRDIKFLSKMAYVADKYELLGMQELLNQNIIEVFTPVNAKKMWEMTKQYNLKKAEEYIYKLFSAEFNE